MIKHFMAGLILVACGSHAFAHVTAMSNNELDEVVLPTQSPQQLQPVLPEYDSNGQIGSIAAGNNPISMSGVQGIHVEAPVANPVIPTLPPAVVAQLNQIFNLASQR